MSRSESRRPIKRTGAGQSAYVRMSVQRRTRCLIAAHGGQAAPIVTQLGGRLTCSPPLALEKGLQIEYDPSLQHIIDRPRQLMRQDRQGLALAVFFL
jgi:hypothetical protein